jgi:hypothetical protein
MVAMLYGSKGVRGGVGERDTQICELIPHRQLHAFIAHWVGASPAEGDIHRLGSVDSKVVGTAEGMQGVKQAL